MLCTEDAAETVQDVQQDPVGKDAAAEEPVNLCGAVTLWDVKALLKEWTTSVEGTEFDEILKI